ncbi:hypothetical protein SASPL_143502 [Salvia splendens]|uniref:Uncharacterized protein n=1 Tax=Salvia splendens TaxID=180675 RepID=A0A8X8WL07_SALSN|nr:hypothetical protein SASPL_143502 [Salvia splendens]
MGGSGGSPAGTNSLRGFLHSPGATFRSRGRTLHSKAEAVGSLPLAANSEGKTPVADSEGETQATGTTWVAAGSAWEAAVTTTILAGSPVGTNSLGGFLHSPAATFLSCGRTLRSKAEAGSLSLAVDSAAPTLVPVDR